MTYQEFRDNNNNKYLDYDKSYGYQCWDLAQYYFTQVLNVPESVLSGCAWVKNMVLWDWKYEILLQYFDKISVYEMMPGDVCIWTGGDGHIAIFDHWDGNNNIYFSQDPYLNLPCGLRGVDLSGINAFRRKKTTPPAPEPTPVITPNVERNEYRNQIEVKVDNLRIRKEPNGEIIGKATEGFYNYSETQDKDGYTWYKIANENWIASNDEWTTVYPAKPQDEFIKLKVLDKKDGLVLVDLGKVWVAE